MVRQSHTSVQRHRGSVTPGSHCGGGDSSPVHPPGQGRNEREVCTMSSGCSCLASFQSYAFDLGRIQLNS